MLYVLLFTLARAEGPPIGPLEADEAAWFDEHPESPLPLPASEEPTEDVVPAVTPSPFEELIPHVRARGVRTALFLGFSAMVFAMAGAGLRRLARRLRPTGVLPTTVRTIEVVARMLVAFLGLGAFGAMVPASIAPVLPIVVIASAVAIGWSVRDVARDLVAGVFIAVEGQLRAGYWVSGERYSGSVEALGLRVTWLRDVHGRRIVVPNRVLLAQPLVTDDKPWPRIQFRVALPLAQSTSAIRDALEEAVLISPWVAPEPEMEVHPDALDSTIWHVAVRVIDSRYAHRFQGLLRERVEEILAS